jgi:hypothetical protein
VTRRLAVVSSLLESATSAAADRHRFPAQSWR